METGNDELNFVPPSVDALNATIGKSYEIKSLIGAGGMAAVYQAIQRNLARQVAIKVLPPLSGPYAEEMRLRFEDEARIMAQLQHDHIVAIYDYGETSEGLPFLVMELVKGESLFEIMIRELVDPVQVIEWIKQLCEGLHHIHEQNLIHLDLKPSNLMISGDERDLKIGDFGLAESGRMIGVISTDRPAWVTPGYSAPECFTRAGQVDCRADVYSVGAIFYELLAGRLPEVEYVAPSGQVMGLNPRLDEIIEECLRSDPDLRMPNAKYLGIELEHLDSPFLSKSVPSHHSASLMSAGRGDLRYGKGIAWGIGGVAGCLAIFAGLISFFQYQEKIQIHGQLGESESRNRHLEQELARHSDLESEARRSIREIEQRNSELENSIKVLKAYPPAVIEDSPVEKAPKTDIDEQLRKAESERDQLIREFEEYKQKYRVEARRRATGSEWARLETITGRVFYNAVITEISDAYVKVKYSSGLASIPLDELTEELQGEFAYSPKLAAMEIEKEKKREQIVAQSLTQMREQAQLLQHERFLETAQSRIVALKKNAELIAARIEATENEAGKAIRTSRVDKDRTISGLMSELDSVNREIQDLERESDALRSGN